MLDTKDENKPTPRHIIGNFRTLELKENPNNFRQKKKSGWEITIFSNFNSNIGLKRQDKILKENCFQSKIVYPVKLWIKYGNIIVMFRHERRLKER